MGHRFAATTARGMARATHREFICYDGRLHRKGAGAVIPTCLARSRLFPLDPAKPTPLLGPMLGPQPVPVK